MLHDNVYGLNLMMIWIFSSVLLPSFDTLPIYCDGKSQHCLSEAYRTESSLLGALRMQSGLFDRLPPPDKNIKPWVLTFFLIGLGRTVVWSFSRAVMILIIYTAGKQMFHDIMVKVSHLIVHDRALTLLQICAKDVPLDCNNYLISNGSQPCLKLSLSSSWTLFPPLTEAEVPITLAWLLFREQAHKVGMLSSPKHPCWFSGNFSIKFWGKSRDLTEIPALNWNSRRSDPHASSGI